MSSMRNCSTALWFASTNAPASAWAFSRRPAAAKIHGEDRKSTRLNSSHSQISYAVFCLKKKRLHFPAAPLGSALREHLRVHATLPDPQRRMNHSTPKRHPPHSHVHPHRQNLPHPIAAAP